MSSLFAAPGQSPAHRDPVHFADLFDLVTARAPERPCQVHGDRTTTWGETRARAASLGRGLADLGLGRQAKVAQHLHNVPEYMESVWACFAAALVPVNTNYRYKDAELRYLWTNADVEAVVFQGTFAEVVDRVRPDVPGVRAWLWVDDGTGPCPSWAVPYEDVARSQLDAEPPWARSGDDISLLYTGGTTGVPKGVMWRMADYTAVLAGPVDAATGLPSADPAVHLPACPLMHGVGLHSSLKAWSSGGVIVTLEGRRFDVVELLDAVDRTRPTSLAIVGDAFGRPMVAELDAHPGRWDISSLRLVTSSGVMWSPATKQGLLAHNRRMTLIDTLGSSEALGVASSAVTADDEVRSARFRPTPNASVLDDEGRPVVPGSGQIGLVAVQGRVPLGYYKDPERSATTFREVDGVRWSIPGDHATLAADGTIELLGRGNLCINRGGEKIFPEEVEEALKTHPEVRDALVLGLPDERLGAEVYAVVEPEGSATPTSDALAAHVRGQLAGYKAPKHVAVVPAIERAANGKADYARWREHLTALLAPTPARTA